MFTAEQQQIVPLKNTLGMLTKINEVIDKINVLTIAVSKNPTFAAEFERAFKLYHGLK